MRENPNNSSVEVEIDFSFELESRGKESPALVTSQPSGTHVFFFVPFILGTMISSRCLVVLDGFWSLSHCQGQGTISNLSWLP